MDFYIYSAYRLSDKTENLFTPEGHRMPKFIAAMTLSITLALNYGFVILILERVFNYQIILEQTNVFMFIWVLIIIITCYIYLIRKRLDKVILKYDALSSKRKKTQAYLSILYLLISFLIVPIML
jgi:hypothetical protein